ncbi:hypothetical protein EDD18DRAFT_1108582 [Armillaria luteobubalina]|uniref:Uncharacterized protein n=1 Tax=Armillaria luteobubalina TaxID=153913 RepID=A0AA39PZM9_9AGAR|nr:hypothetical protein EDD18DRAFT_1108582 [Armillaria luteobubalina]
MHFLDQPITDYYPSGLRALTLGLKECTDTKFNGAFNPSGFTSTIAKGPGCLMGKRDDGGGGRSKPRGLGLRRGTIQATEKIMGTGRPVDAIITPVAPYAAPPHGLNRQDLEFMMAPTLEASRRNLTQQNETEAVWRALNHVEERWGHPKAKKVEMWLCDERRRRKEEFRGKLSSVSVQISCTDVGQTSKWTRMPNQPIRGEGFGMIISSKLEVLGVASEEEDYGDEDRESGAVYCLRHRRRRRWARIANLVEGVEEEHQDWIR